MAAIGKWAELVSIAVLALVELCRWVGVGPGDGPDPVGWLLPLLLSLGRAKQPLRGERDPGL